MSDHLPPNSPGRQTNAAEPPGKTPGLKSDADQAKTGERSRKAAGPDGPDAREVGDTFKK
ncbi:MAG: hypothetical protein EON95_08470 [Caulobacteraceae bacterium]|nr:hypothetical protein [Caulobacter sp.]RYF93578.1 MAG: hypothetical protein EON95_08470 [Caulobacteraceae bacterium]